jgi:hypothetical protein
MNQATTVICIAGVLLLATGCDQRGAGTPSAGSPQMQGQKQEMTEKMKTMPRNTGPGRPPMGGPGGGGMPGMPGAPGGMPGAPGGMPGMPRPQ